MKRFIALLLLGTAIVSALTLAGCSTKPPQVVNSQILIGVDKIPPESAKWAREERRIQQVIRKTFGSWDVYVVAMGEKRTGGYSVKIDNAGLDSGKQWIVDVVFVEPGQGQMVTQVLTYPFAAFAVRKGMPVKVRLLDPTGGVRELPIHEQR